MKRQRIKIWLVWRAVFLTALVTTLVVQMPPARAQQAGARSGGQRGTPVYNAVEGQPIEGSAPRNPYEKPAFPGQTRAPYHRTALFTVTTLLDNMHVPYSMAVLPDGKLLLVLRLPGEMRTLDKQGVLSEPLTGLDPVYMNEPVAGLAAMSSTPQFGLLDMQLDPHFATNHRLFFTFFDYVAPKAGADFTNSNTFVASAVLDEAASALTEVKIIFHTTPAIPSTRLGGKTGGRIAIAPDGSLFVGLGDRDDDDVPWSVSQQLDNDLGKIIHITPDGGPAPGNPFIGQPQALPEIWAYGLRNPEGLAIDPKTGELWNSDIGPEGGDTISLIKKGGNYGWPIISYGIKYNKPSIGRDSNGIEVGNGYTQNAGMIQPTYYWDTTPSVTPSGLTFYKGDLFPQWKNSLLSGTLSGEMLDRLEIRGDKVVAEEAILQGITPHGIRDVVVGPDGAVYVLTDSGGGNPNPDTPFTSKILKLTPK